MILGELGNWGDRMSLKIQLFENQRIRTAWDEEKEEWYFSIVDVVGVLTDHFLSSFMPFTTVLSMSPVLP